MILVEANLLIYAYDPDCDQHEASRRWVEQILSGAVPVRFAWLTLWAFIRISTNLHVFLHPLSAEEAHAAVASWQQRATSGTACQAPSGKRGN